MLIKYKGISKNNKQKFANGYAELYVKSKIKEINDINEYKENQM